MRTQKEDELEEAIQCFYLHEYYSDRLEELMKESLSLLESGRREIDQDGSELSRMRKKRRLLKMLHGKSSELYDLGIDLFQAAVRAEAEIRKRLISLEIEETLDKKHKKLDSYFEL